MRRQRPPVHPGYFAFQRLSLASVCLRRRSGGNVVREVSYAGTEHIGPEDTFDADYGRLLEAVQNRGKRLASLSTPSWNQIMAWLREMAELRETGTVAA